MATYIVKQHNDYDGFHRRWNTRYIIYKKCWYGWSWKSHTEDVDEIKQMIDNLIRQGNEVRKHWTVTVPLNIN